MNRHISFLMKYYYVQYASFHRETSATFAHFRREDGAVCGVISNLHIRYDLSKNFPSILRALWISK